MIDGNLLKVKFIIAIHSFFFFFQLSSLGDSSVSEKATGGLHRNAATSQWVELKSDAAARIISFMRPLKMNGEERFLSAADVGSLINNWGHCY